MEQHDLLEVLDGVVLNSHEAQSVDHAVAHGDALNDVEGGEVVLLLDKHGGEEVAHDGEAVEGRPAQHVGAEDAHEHEHGLPAAAQALSDLLRLEARHRLEPQLAGDPGVAQGHGDHGAYELDAKDEEEVGLVVDLLVHRPDLATEDLLLALDDDEDRFSGEVGRRDGDKDGHHPHQGNQASGCLILHPGSQRVDDGQISRPRTEIGSTTARGNFWVMVLFRQQQKVHVCRINNCVGSQEKQAEVQTTVPPLTGYCKLRQVLFHLSESQFSYLQN